MSKIVFYGDSITNRFELLKQNKNVVNLGIGGDKTTDLIGRVLEIIREKPEKVFLMIGINDFLVKKSYWQEFFNIDFEVTYNALIKLLSDNLPKAEFTLLSILPICQIKTYDILTQYNQEIDTLNNYIKSIANSYNYNYLNIAKVFKDNQNFLKREYTDDGVHLNSLGYETYYDLVKDLI